MPRSNYLSPIQLRGLARTGDVLIPGGLGMPCFSQSGALQHADRMLAYMTPFDLAGVRLALTVFAFLPKFAIHAILLLTERHRIFPGPLAAACRMLNLGLKGVAMTLYYSDLGEGTRPILPLIGWDAHVSERA